MRDKNNNEIKAGETVFSLKHKKAVTVISEVEGFKELLCRFNDGGNQPQEIEVSPHNIIKLLSDSEKLEEISSEVQKCYDKNSENVLEECKNNAEAKNIIHRGGFLSGVEFALDVIKRVKEIR